LGELVTLAQPWSFTLEARSKNHRFARIGCNLPASSYQELRWCWKKDPATGLAAIPYMQEVIDPQINPVLTFPPGCVLRVERLLLTEKGGCYVTLTIRSHPDPLCKPMLKKRFQATVDEFEGLHAVDPRVPLPTQSAFSNDYDPNEDE
jgi:hypothetical protein